MVKGALIGKYLSQVNQLKLISDLIQNDDLGQVLELIESASLNISIDSEIESSIFEKVTEQVVEYARRRMNTVRCSVLQELKERCPKNLCTLTMPLAWCMGKISDMDILPIIRYHQQKLQTSF